MRQDLQSIFMVLVATIMAYFLMRFMGLTRKENKSWYFVWMCITCLAFLLHNFYLIVGFLVLLKLFWVKNDLDKSILLFLFLLPCLPTVQSYWLPIDAIHILFTDYREALILILIFPLLPKLVRQSSIDSRNIIFYLPLLYLIGFDVFAMLDSEINLTQSKRAAIIENTWTNQIRGLVTVLIFKYLPFYAAAVWCTSTRKVMKAMHAIASSGIILLVLAVPSALLGWDIYHGLNLGGNLPDAPLYERGLFIRIKLTSVHPIIFGKLAFLTLSCLLGLLMIKGIRIKLFIFALLITVPAIFLTGSRSAYIGTLIVVIGYFYFSMRQQSRKLTAFASIILVAIIAVPYALETGSVEATDFSAVDSEGTFDYRKRLLLAGMAVIPDNPFFGNPDFINEPEFLALRQGEGIIDTLNKWLIMSVEYGLIYTLLFLIFFIRVLKYSKKLAISGWDNNRTTNISLGAGLSACLAAFAVTAVFDNFSDYLFLLYGLCFGIGHSLQKDETQNNKQTISYSS